MATVDAPTDSTDEPTLWRKQTLDSLTTRFYRDGVKVALWRQRDTWVVERHVKGEGMTHREMNTDEKQARLIARGLMSLGEITAIEYP